MSGFDALDDFAGPGGWDEGARMVGLRCVGVEWDMAACQTAVAAGHARIRADVAAYPSEPFTGIPGYIASPPCQAWSMAGDRKGELDRANCHILADRMAVGDDSIDWTEWEDTRSALVCQPVRRVRELRPEWVALEEVPAVLGLWEHFARIFRGWGYSVWVGVLNAADYGVPQTRRRAILMASRLARMAPPTPTHSREGDTGDLFGASREKWVSMASALGWGFPEPSADTLTGKGTAYWVQRERSGDRAEEGFDPHETPAQCLTSKTRSWQLHSSGSSIARVTAEEAGVLQSFPVDYPWQGSRTKQFQQVGNAVPPLLAAHVLAALTGTQIGQVAA